MTNPTTDTHTAISDAHNAIINAHKAAADEHRACAEFHLKAAACHEQGQPIDAKDSANKAMSCCDSASKQSANACACS
jgi:hypothetical protein